MCAAFVKRHVSLSAQGKFELRVCVLNTPSEYNVGRSVCLHTFYVLSNFATFFVMLLMVEVSG